MALEPSLKNINADFNTVGSWCKIYFISLVLPDTAGQEPLGRRQNLDLRVSHVKLSLDEECGLLANGHLLQALPAQVDLGRIHDGALERAAGHVLPVELELHDVGLGLLGDEGDGVGVVALGLGTGGDLAVVNCETKGGKWKYSYHQKIIQNQGSETLSDAATNYYFSQNLI